MGGREGLLDHYVITFGDHQGELVRKVREGLEELSAFRNLLLEAVLMPFAIDAEVLPARVSSTYGSADVSRSWDWTAS